MTQDDKRPLPDDRTIPTRGAGRERLFLETPIDPIPPDAKPSPWLLELHFRAEADINRELAMRFPNMPVMSTIHFRTLGDKLKSHVATVSTQDGAASVIVEIDPPSKAVCFTYMLNSMLAYRFVLGKMNDKDRWHWMQEMRTARGELAFLWDQTRWEHDYLIGVSFKHYTNLFAFSPLHVEAGVRLTSDISRKLLDWLEGFWKVDLQNDQTPSSLPW